MSKKCRKCCPGIHTCNMYLQTSFFVGTDKYYHEKQLSTNKSIINTIKITTNARRNVVELHNTVGIHRMYKNTEIYTYIYRYQYNMENTGNKELYFNH